MFYVIAFILTVIILRVETKAQQKSIEILKKENLLISTKIQVSAY